MKGIISNLFLLVFTGLFAIVTTTCRKLEKSMLVLTSEVTNILTNSAEASGMVIDLGEGATQHGHCYGTSPGVSTTGSKTQLGTPPTGGFTSQLTNLESNSKYYIKAYISNGAKIVYGKEVSFSTLSPSIPTITTIAISSITGTSASSGGEISNDGGAPVTERGVCWNTTTSPTTADSKTSDDTGSDIYSSKITGLTISTTYYVRAYATNSAGTAYGNELSFSTSSIPPEIPKLLTTEISAITITTANSGGNVTDDGGASVISRGVCWSPDTNPTIADSKTSDGTGTGSFVSNLDGLTGGTTYHVRAYATNSVGTGYGSDISFTTNTVEVPIIPTVTSTAISGITSTTATGGGNVTADGGAAVTTRGVCWSISQNPTVTDSHTEDGDGTGVFISSLTNLTPGTTYYVKAFASNSAGTAYGVEVSFTTLGIPTISTAAISSITATTATSGGNITSDGGAEITARGVCWSTTANPTTADSNTTDGTGVGIFTSNITGLTSLTIYHVRAYATNSEGTFYGDDIIFTTSAFLPTVTTAEISLITSSTAISGGNIASDGGAAVTDRGVCWSINQFPTITDNKTSDGIGTGNFTSNITGLLPNTNYYVRAYATNSAGTTYGDQVSFVSNILTVTDADGNVYNTVNIGTQVWMRENLKTTKYNDGTVIPNITDNVAWETSTTGAYCDYDNTLDNSDIYGKLYNWNVAASTNPKNVCPTGMHVPTNADWTIMEDYLIANGYNYDGTFSGNKIAKSLAATTDWDGSSTPGAVGNSDYPTYRNKSGFTALPGGQRDSLGIYAHRRSFGFWWSSSEEDPINALFRRLFFEEIVVLTGSINKQSGLSIRCLRD
ncbi:MAG TPA: FISUMP domain-containing protein [Bacteroidales bacterium]|nr:FISUMP domain-containing protein [Bacteroidales bacterium]HUX97491.1 FISUMP domain-containing protein [Bacteroidales bacterium]